MIGRTFGHYKVEEQLGAGGMGTVYRATASKLGPQVAIKFLPRAFARDLPHEEPQSSKSANPALSLQLCAVDATRADGLRSIQGLPQEAGVRPLRL
jgi:serine/threonine protein kinase